MKKTRHGDYEAVIGFAVWSNYQLHIVFTEDIQHSYKKRYPTGKADVENADGLHVATNDGESHLFFPMHATPNSIAHESWHATRRLLEYCGAELDNETVAYHIGYIVGEVHKFKSKIEEGLNEPSSVAQG